MAMAAGTEMAEGAALVTGESPEQLMGQTGVGLGGRRISVGADRVFLGKNEGPSRVAGNGKQQRTKFPTWQGLEKIILLPSERPTPPFLDLGRPNADVSVGR